MDAGHPSTRAVNYSTRVVDAGPQAELQLKSISRLAWSESRQPPLGIVLQAYTSEKITETEYAEADLWESR